MWYELFIDHKLLPDWILRYICRLSVGRYAHEIDRYDSTTIETIQSAFRNACMSGELAINTNEANYQHYEIPTELFIAALGNRLKYSSSYWSPGLEKLDDAELDTLRLYEERGSLEDGQRILDLGAGWGATSLYLAEQHTNAQITAVTNSSTQAGFIESARMEKQLDNLRVVKCDVNSLMFKEKFDRVIAIEMFEHTRNATELLRRISGWLETDGKLFIQVFSHRFYPQMFDDVRNSWMARRFFTGGIMPYDGFYNDCNTTLIHDQMWAESGLHYHKTLEAWLHNIDATKSRLLFSHKGSPTRLNRVTLNRFRMFLIACSELFKFNNGRDWHVVNHLFSNSVD